MKIKVEVEIADHLFSVPRDQLKSSLARDLTPVCEDITDIVMKEHDERNQYEPSVIHSVTLLEPVEEQGAT